MKQYFKLLPLMKICSDRFMKKLEENQKKEFFITK